MKILCIISTPKPKEESYGKKLVEVFLEGYKLENPSHQIDILDLYSENYQVLKYEDIKSSITSRDGMMIKEAQNFKKYDKYVIVAPMWNLSVPSILKSYLDHIIVSGETFKYTKYGVPKGLLKNKKVLYIGTRGGAYPFPISLIAFDLKYIKYIFKFIGIKNFNYFLLENIDKYPNKIEKIYQSLDCIIKCNKKRPIDIFLI